MKMKKLISTVLAGAMLLGSAVIFTSGAAEGEKTLTPLKMYGVTVNEGQVCKIPGNPTVGEFKAMFNEEAELIVTAGDKTLSDADPLPSGAVVANGDVTAAVHVYGDTNGDGKINLSDVSTLLKKIAGWEVSLDVTAGDVNVDAKTNLTDASNILKKIAGWRVNLGNAMISVTEEPQKAAKEDGSLLLAFGNGIDRYTPDTEIGNAATDVMYCARNEIEFTQFALKSDVGHTGLSVEITPFTNANGDTLRTEMYCENFISISDTRSDVDKIADVMSPILDGISVKADAIQPFGIKAFTEEDTPYGMYEATVSVKDADGNQIKKALVFLYVWDFVLPEASYCRTSFGLFPYNIGSSSTATVEERYKNYYDFFIENRMNPTLLPYDICSDEADAYLNDPRVNSFLAGGDGYGGSYDTTDQQLVDRYAKLSQNEEWMKKAYFYYDDEPLPWTKDNVDTVEMQTSSIKYNYQHVRELFPGAKIVIPNHHNEITDDDPAQMSFGADIVGFCIEYSTILCPHMWMFNDTAIPSTNVVYTPEMVERFGSMKSRIDAKLASDPEAEFWWYSSDNPRKGMCNIYITKPGIECRTLFWQQYLYDADGFLYWLVSEFDKVNSRNTSMTDMYSGLLCYNNKVYKTDEAVGANRVEMVRDGIEDFDYLHMIEDRFGKEVADAFVARITTHLIDYNTDSAVLEAVRMEMGELLQGGR